MKIALVVATDDPDPEVLAHQVRCMAAAQTLLPGQETRIVEGPGFALACTTGGEQATRCRAFRRSENGNVLAFAGYPFLLGEDAEVRLDQICAAGVDVAKKALANMDGAYVWVFWDQGAKRLLIGSDHVGFYPFYEMGMKGLRLFATELKGLAAAVGSGIQPDPTGWAAFIGLGYMTLDLTMLAGARAFRQGCMLELVPGQKEEKEVITWRWPEPTGPDRPEEVDTAHLLDLLVREIESYETAYHSDAVHLLSGGWDSRVVLGARSMLRSDLKSVAVRYRFDERHEADSVLAAECAKAVGARHRCVTPPSDFYSRPSFQQFLAMTDVATPGLDLLVPTVMAAVEPSLEAVWEGVAAGSSMFGNLSGIDTLDAFLADAMAPEQGKVWRAVDALFSTEFAGQLRDGLSDLKNRIHDSFGESPEELIRFRANSRNRFRTAKLPFAVYSNQIATLCPPMGREFWSITRALKAEAVRNKGVHRVLLERHFPALAKIPVLTGGSWYPSQPEPKRLGWLGQMKSRISRRLTNHRAQGESWQKESVIQSVVDRVDPGDSFLNADMVNRLKSDPKAAGEDSGQVRRLLYYWHQWSQVMGRR